MIDEGCHMGEWFNVVNPSRRQYLDPLRMYWGPKMRGIIGGTPALAVSLLVCRPLQIQGHDLLGSWHGDAVFLAGDQEPPNLAGPTTVTAENPDRNLHFMAIEEFEDISVPALDMLVRHVDGIADTWAERAANDAQDMVTLGSAAFATESSTLRSALESRFGHDWPKLYKAASKRPSVQAWRGLTAPRDSDSDGRS
jgi:hypothetical protein